MALAEIGIEELEISCIIGDRPEERQHEQSIFVTVRWPWDCSKVAISDSLDDTVDYTAVVAICQSVAKKGKYQLIETLGESMAKALLETLSLKEVSIWIKKPAAISQCCGSSFHLKRQVKTLCPSQS